MMRTRLFLAILLALVSADVYTFGEVLNGKPEDSSKSSKYVALGQTNTGFLAFAVGVKKQTFILDEPIEVSFILTNNSDSKKRLAEPSWGVSMVGVKITQIEGVKPIPVQPVQCGAGPAVDFGWDFIPGESRYDTANILDFYPNGIPVGRYSIQGSYRVPDYLSVDWYNAMQSEPIEISIVNPATEQESKVRQIYVKAKKFYSHSKTSANIIGMSSDIEEIGEVGLFNKYVEFYEADAYRNMGNMDEYKTKILSYVEMHGNVDRNSLLGLTGLGNYYQIEKKNYEEARKIYRMLPDGYDRFNYLRNCDLREAHRKNTEKDTIE